MSKQQQNCGIRGNCLKWFKNCLEFRYYVLKVAEELNTQREARYGVAQGIKLGPILFLSYTNEINNILKTSTSFAYADDTAIVVSQLTHNSPHN